MRVLEDIDRVLSESVKHLGLPKIIEKSITQKISHRKNQRYLGQFFKQFNIQPDSLRKALEGVASNINYKYTSKILKKFGVQSVEVRSDSDYSMRDMNNIDKEFSKLYLKADTVDDVLTIIKKVKKALRGGPRVGKEEALRQLSGYLYSELKRFFEKYKTLTMMLKDNPDAYKKFKNLSLEQAIEKIKEGSIPTSIDESRILMEFSNGFFWYEITEEECEIEGEFLDHCGSPDRSNSAMFSLRDQHNRPHVTLEYDDMPDEIVQIRGENNNIPPKKTWNMIRSIVSELGGHIVDLWDDERELEFLAHITENGGSFTLSSVNDIQKIKDYSRSFIERLNHNMAGSHLGRTVKFFGMATYEGYVQQGEVVIDPIISLDIEIEFEAFVKSDNDNSVEDVNDVKELFSGDDLPSESEVVDELMSSTEKYHGGLIRSMDYSYVESSSDSDVAIKISTLRLEPDLFESDVEDIMNYFSSVEESFSPDSMDNFIGNLLDMYSL